MTGFFVAVTEPIAGGQDLVPPAWRTGAALVIVLALLSGVLWLLRKGLAAKRSRGQFGVESALPLGERRSLAIVVVEGRRLLLGLSPTQVTLVTELTPAAAFEHAVERAIETGPRA